MKPVSLFAGALFLSTLISAVPNANGAIIEPIDLFAPGDGAATFVDTTGLNWLDLTFTFGMSVPDVESDLTLGGLLDDSWRVAELSEIDALLTAYGFTPDSSCNNGAQHCSASGENAAAAVNFVFDLKATGAGSAAGLFQNENLVDGLIGRAFVDHGDLGSPGSTVDARSDFFELITYSSGAEGVFLVQNAFPQEDPETIPAPPPAWLFVFGLGVLGVLRRRASGPSLNRAV